MTGMRRLAGWTVAAALLLAAPATMAAVPQVMNAQGVLRTAGGQAVDGSYGLTFNLYGEQSGGTALWSETIASVPVKGGLFSVLLGNGTPIPPALFAQSDSLWLAIQVEGDVELPRERMVTQAFAFEAEHATSADTADTAASADALSCSGCITGIHIAAGSLDGTKLAANSVGSAQIADGAVAPGDVSFNYAAGTTKGGAATNVECAGCIEASEVSFGYAGSATAGGPAGDLACTGCVSAAELDFAAVSQADLATAIAAIDIPAVTLESLSCGADQVPKWDGSAWGCADLPTGFTPDAACNGEFEALQWDGSKYTCVKILSSGASGGFAKGFEAKDSWGYTWDGLERQAATWAVADAACKSKGGRLPTMTELYRVSGAGLSEVGNTYETNYLWAITWWNTGNHGRVRLTDGATAGYANGSVSAYRCVWPNNTAGFFTGNHCYGPPGAECATSNDGGKRSNMDIYERPPMPYTAAVEECGIYHAHLANMIDYAEFATFGAGLPNGSNSWLWTSDSNYYDRSEIVRWNGTDTAFHAGDTTYTSWQYRGTTSYRFRCVGVNYDAGSHPNAVDNEFVTPTTYVKGEKFDRGLELFGPAASLCLSNGGHLASERDLTELVRSGLPNGTNNLMWTSDASGAANQQVIRWSSIMPEFTDYYAADATWAARSETHVYRCAYYPVDTDYTGPTGGKCVSGSDCYTLQKGGTTPIKVWTDNFDRSPVNWITAVKSCYLEGGHLASTRDYTEFVRSGLGNGSGNWLWTSDSVESGNNALLVKWSGTDTAFTGVSGTYATNSSRATGTTRPYRCAWTNELR